MIDQIAVVAGIAMAVFSLIFAALKTRTAKVYDREMERIAEIANAHSVAVKERQALLVDELVNKVSECAEATGLPKEELAKLVLGSKVRGLDPSQDEGWRLVEDLITSYHRQALQEARIQFWFSIAAASIGFGLIASAATIAAKSTVNEALLRALPGTVIEAVAALFFRQASEIRERATALYDRLRSDRKYSQAIMIVNSIEQPDLRSMVKARLALHIVGLTVSAQQLEGQTRRLEYKSKRRPPAGDKTVTDNGRYVSTQGNDALDDSIGVNPIRSTSLPIKDGGNTH
jgi:hypothetical protein